MANSPTELRYRIVYLGSIVLKFQPATRFINKFMVLTLGINIEGHKELLYMWQTENEGAMFWPEGELCGGTSTRRAGGLR